MPETLSVLEQIKQAHGYSYQFLHQKPFSEVMVAKKKARIVIDEMVTGGYHLSGLEGLSLGKPVFSYLDDRTQFVLRAVSGASECPFISVRLEESKYLLTELLGDFDLCEAIGSFSRRWIEEYWADRNLISHYVSFYNLLIENDARVFRQEELKIESERKKFFYIDLQNKSHALRKENNLNLITLPAKIRKIFVKKINKILNKN
jgi:hypothetical protein